MTAWRVGSVGFLLVLVAACGTSQSQGVPNGATDDRDGGAAALRDGGSVDEVQASAPPKILPSDPDAPSCQACVARKIEWSYDGGLTPTFKTYSLTPCAAYSVDVRPSALFPEGTPPRTCTDTIPRCYADAISRALTDADVVAALAEANETDDPTDDKIYGDDHRASDGAVIDVKIEKKTLVVGWGECSTDPGPNCVPHGLRHFVDLLLAVGREKEKTTPCDLD